MINELKITKFSSLEEFIDYTSNCPKRRLTFGNWEGADSYEEAVKIARYGVELGRAEQTLKELSHSRQEISQVTDVCGSVVNMDAYLIGEPENMWEFLVSEQPLKFLNLFIDIGEYSSVSADEMVNKAIATASIVNDLENNGYRIAISVGRIQAFDKSYNNGRYNNHESVLATIIKIKDYHQSLSIGQLTGVCHPSFYRVLMFSHYENIFKNTFGPPSGNGRTVDTEGDIMEVLKQISDPDMVFIPNSSLASILSKGSMPGNLFTVQSAVNMVQYFINN